MTDNNRFKPDIAPTYESLVRLSHLTQDLPAEIRGLITEVVDAATTNLKDLQIVVGELQRQNEELVTAHQEIEVQHTRYRDLIELAPNGYLVTDLAGVIREANQAAAELLGISKDRLAGKPLVDYIEPGERDQFHRRLNTLIEAHKAKPGAMEWKIGFQSHQKRLFPAALTSAPIVDASGRVAGLHWLLYDMTASKQAEERERLLAEAREQRQLAEEANRLLETVIKTLPIGAVISDASGNILAINTAGRTILGLAPGRMVEYPRQTHISYYHDGTPMPPEETPLMRALQQHEIVQNVEMLIRPADGAAITLQVSAAPVLDDSGEIERGVSIFQDVSERKRMTDALDMERMRLKTVIDNTPTGIIVADTQGVVLVVNPAADALYGRSMSIGQSVSDAPGVSFYYADGTPCDSRELPVTRSALDGETITGLELVVVQPDGQRFDLLVNASPIRDKAGHIQGAVSALRDITEIKRFMNELETEQTRLKAIIDNVPAGIIVSNMKAEISLINPAFDALYQRILLESEHGMKLCHPDGTPYALEEMPFARSAIAGEVVTGEEMSVIWADGTRTDLLVNSAPIRNGEGGQQTAVGTFQDITDIKEAQRTLQLYAERLRVLNSASQIILASESIDEIIDTVLPFVSKLVHWQRGSVMIFDHEKGDTIILGVHADQQTALEKGMRLSLPKEWPMKDLAKGKVVTFDISQDLTLQSELAQVLRAEEVCSLVTMPLMAHDELLGVLSMGFKEPVSLTPEYQEIIRQIADGLAIGIWQMRLQEKLRQHASQLEQVVARRTAALQDSVARFRTIFEASVIGIALLNEKGRVVTSNPAFQHMLGRREDELRNTTLTDYMHPDDAKEEKKSYCDLAAGKLDDYQAERRYIHQDGSERWGELTVSRIKGLNKNKRRFAIAMTRDITQRKINQEALIRSERLAIAGRLGASLAHEINNPLQSVIGCLGLAQEMLDDDESSEVYRYFTIATEELERAASIVSQLRDLSRSSEAIKEPADLNALVEKALLLTKRQCQDQGVKVEWIPAPNIPPVSLVPGRIQQVFLNLLLNALEAMPEGGQLQVQTVLTRRPKGVRITFADSGVGIEPGKLEQIFEPFQSTRPGGLGLGLYISKNIIDDHNGLIEVKSRLREETTFTLWLPG